MSLNFSDFKAVETTNKRTGGVAKRGQNFDVRYRKFVSKKGKDGEAEEEFIHISDKLFDQFQLEDRALRQIVSPDGQSFLAVVDDENGTLLKRSISKDGTPQGKGRKFKSTVISDALQAEGLIDKSIVGDSQLLNFEVVAENAAIGSGDKAFTAYQVLKVVKGEATEGSANDSNEEDEDENIQDNNPTTAPANVEEDEF